MRIRDFAAIMEHPMRMEEQDGHILSFDRSHAHSHDDCVRRPAASYILAGIVAAANDSDGRRHAAKAGELYGILRSRYGDGSARWRPGMSIIS